MIGNMHRYPLNLRKWGGGVQGPGISRVLYALSLCYLHLFLKLSEGIKKHSR